ncbi:MAG TPA: hypothetical protein VMB03_22740 [Bryobacteraceae bacterium]|nr:hypothetical protein [Bryobacteraceae bacterium]
MNQYVRNQGDVISIAQTLDGYLWPDSDFCLVRLTAFEPCHFSRRPARRGIET